MCGTLTGIYTCDLIKFVYRIKIFTIKQIIREAWCDKRDYQGFTDDFHWNQRSVYVPEDIKSAIVDWMEEMGLSPHKIR